MSDSKNELHKQQETLDDTLIESQRILKTLMENLPGMVFRCRNDENWTMEFISDICFELTGYIPDDLILNKRLSFADLIFEDDRQKISEVVQEKLASSNRYTVEYRIRTAEGKIKWVWEQGKGIYDPTGKLLTIEGYISDISEEKKLESVRSVVFEISKSAYTSESLDDFFKSVHKQLGRIIDASNFFVATYHKETDSISLPYHVDFKDKFAIFPAGKTLTGYVIRTQKPLLVTDCQIRELAEKGQIDIVGTLAKIWMGIPLILDNEVIGIIAVQSYTDSSQYTIQDLELMKFVADQIAIAISRKTAEESFHKEQANLDQLFKSSREAIVKIDTEGKVLAANLEFIRLFGFTSQECIGQPIDDLITTPEIMDEALQLTQSITSGELPEIETRRKHRDGHMIDVSVIVTPIHFNEDVIGGYGIYRDITERKRIAKNLIVAKEKAEESDKLKSAFLSNMSHEIRTPMNAILGFSTLLSDPSVSEEERSEFIRIIKDRGNDLMRIIDDIIDVAKIESGQIKIEIKDCPVNVLMANLLVTLNEVKRKQAKHQVELNCLPGNTDKNFTILTDSNRLRQILTNLIENGLKFTEKGFVEFGYQLKTLDSGPGIEFFVRDSGIGIPKEMHSLIFERFRQVDDTNTRKYGGTGLGLTISKNLIQLLGGTVRLDSDRGQGTRFFVTLPLQVTSPPVVATPQEKPATISAPIWKGKSILVAEDEESNFFLLDRILKRTGAVLTWVKNGSEAVEMCKDHTFDLVLMDIRMPVMDGYEATEIIKKTNKDITIIAQTAYALKGEREKSLVAGCDNYISKPIDSRELFSILGKYMNT